MEESKTLVDQLREMVEKSREDGGFPTWYAGGSNANCPYNSDVDYEQELFTAIADRIEREYLPRPRFEDGEPVQFGDEFEHDGKTFVVRGISTTDDGLQHMAARGDEGIFTIERCERVKRPKPEVLDADGVPIHVGDTVYFVDCPNSFDVLSIIKRPGDVTLHIGRKDGTSTDAWPSPGELTHKQPDTLERIEADAMKMLNDYWGCGDAECRCCPAMVGRKKPYERYCTEGCAAAQKLDLLRRQREVLERGQE